MIRFVWHFNSEMYKVFNKEILLGYVDYYEPWSLWVFHAFDYQRIFDSSCLRRLVWFLERLKGKLPKDIEG